MVVIIEIHSLKYTNRIETFKIINYLISLFVESAQSLPLIFGEKNTKVWLINIFSFCIY